MEYINSKRYSTDDVSDINIKELLNNLIHYDNIAYDYHMNEQVFGAPVTDFENTMADAVRIIKAAYKHE